MDSASIVKENQLNSNKNQKSKLALNKKHNQQKKNTTKLKTTETYEHMKVGQVGWWRSPTKTL